MEKVLILGGSHRDIPLIKAAQGLGFYVITLGNGNGYIGHKYAQSFYEIDFNNLEEVKKIIEKERIRYFIPGCGEESYINTVKITKELGVGNLDNLEVALLLQNKWEFKKFCLHHNIPVPKGFLWKKGRDFNWNKINLKFPILVKPTNLSGGRGVNLINNINELMDVTKKENKQELILEEFINGKLIAYSVFLKNKKVIYEFIGADEMFINKFLVTTAYPVEIKRAIADEMKRNVEKIAEELNLVDGVFHLQMILKNDVPYIIDVARRIPGDLYPYLIEFCDGVEYSKAAVKAYIGMNLGTEFNSKYKTKRLIARHCVMSKHNGFYKELYIDKRMKDAIIYRLDIVEENKNIEIENFLRTLISIVFVEYERSDECKISAMLNKMIYPVIRGNLTKI